MAAPDVTPEPAAEPAAEEAPLAAPAAALLVPAGADALPAAEADDGGDH